MPTEAEVSPASLVLLNRDLAVLIVGAASEDAVADVWCCPRLSHRSPASVRWTNLRRVAALAAVCRAWRGAVADYLSQPRGRLCGGCDARSDDLALVSAGVSLAAVHTLRLAGLGLELGGAMAPTLQPAPGCPPAPRALPSFVTELSSLTELALPRCALADADLASLLACASRPLRALSLCGALRAGEYTLRAISVAHGDSLLVLDLGGTSRRVGGALAELRGCKVLRTLELAGWLLDDGGPRVTTLDLGGAVLGPTALAALARAPHVRALYLDECHVVEAAHQRRGVALLFTSTSLRRISLLRCAWLTHALLRECHTARPAELPPIAAVHSLRLDLGAASSSASTCPLDSWEDFHVTLSEPKAALPSHLLLRPPEIEPESAHAPLRHVPDVDWSRPAAHRHVARSIYHISQGDEPYYADASAKTGRRAPAQTDAHGLRC